MGQVKISEPFEKLVVEGILENPTIGIVRDSLKGADDLYLVGGAVRDFVFGKPPCDLDFISRTPCVAARAAAKSLNSRVFKLGKGRTLIYRIPCEKGTIDFSSFREKSVSANLAKRDFTIDSMAVHIASMRIIGAEGAAEDILGKTLRMAGPSSLSDDPLRIVKAYRMRAAFPELSWDEKTRESCRALARKVSGVPVERVQAEISRMLSAGRAARAVREMAEDKVLFEVFPGLEKIVELEQSPPHRADVFSHTLEMMDLLDGSLAREGDRTAGLSPEDLLKLRLSILFHDSGKAACFSREGNRIRFLGHEKLSSSIARDCLSRLRFSNALAADVASLCALHMRPILLHHDAHSSLPGMRRLIRDAGMNTRLLFRLADLDFRSMDRKPGEAESFKAMCEQMLDLYEKEGLKITAPPKLIDGLKAMSVLGLDKPGPELGKALIALSDAQTDGEVTTSKEAVRFLKDYRERLLKS